MKILLIAVDDGTLDVGHEIAQISSLHQTTVLTDHSANLKTIFAEVSRNNYDIIHFAGHTSMKNLQTLDSIELADETINLADMARILRSANAKLLFINSCLAARFGFYVVNHGTPAAIFTTVEIEDQTAWQIATDFYRELAVAEKENPPITIKDFRTALNNVANGSGLYGWADSGDITYIRTNLSPGFILFLVSIGCTALLLSILTILLQFN